MDQNRPPPVFEKWILDPIVTMALPCFLLHSMMKPEHQVWAIVFVFYANIARSFFDRREFGRLLDQFQAGVDSVFQKFTHVFWRKDPVSANAIWKEANPERPPPWAMGPVKQREEENSA